MSTAIIFGSAIIAMIGYAVYIVWTRRKFMSELEEFADTHGLEHHPPGFFGNEFTDGTYKERDVSVESRTQTSSSAGSYQQAEYVTYTVSVGGEVPQDLEIRDERLEKFRDSIKLGQPISVGRGRIDGPYTVRCENEERARAILDDDTVETALAQLQESQPLPRMVDRTITIEHNKFSLKAPGVRERFDQMIRLAEALEQRCIQLRQSSQQAVPEW